MRLMRKNECLLGGRRHKQVLVKEKELNMQKRSCDTHMCSKSVMCNSTY